MNLLEIGMSNTIVEVDAFTSLHHDHQWTVTAGQWIDLVSYAFRMLIYTQETENQVLYGHKSLCVTCIFTTYLSVCPTYLKD